MKKIRLLLAMSILVAISLVGQTQAQSGGQLVVINNSSVTYTIYLDGNHVGRVPSGSSLTVDVPAGNHAVVARSDDGQTSSGTYDFTRTIHRVTLRDVPSPHTGWAQLTMQNNTSGTLVLYVGGENRCIALKNFFCTTHVRVGQQNFTARNADGDIVASGTRNFQRGESWTWSVSDDDDE